MIESILDTDSICKSDDAFFVYQIFFEQKSFWNTISVLLGCPFPKSSLAPRNKNFWGQVPPLALQL